MRLSFGSGVLKTAEDLAASLHEQLSALEDDHGLPAEVPDARGRLKRLLRGLHEQAGRRVVVLVDEHDQPILDNLTDPRSRPSLASAESAHPWASRAYLFEFKVVEQVPEGRALAQLQGKGYAEKYREPGVTVTLVGIEFSREQSNVVSLEVAPA